MREVKFRAWDDYHKKMLVVHNLYQHMDANGFTEFECTPKGWSKDGKDYILVSTTAHDNVHIMQYTGLKDRNGMGIFEGDIINIPFGRAEYDDGEISGYKVLQCVPCVVEWQFGGFYPKPIWGKKKLQKMIPRRQYSLWGKHRDEEVIGNIYENGYLLK